MDQNLKKILNTSKSDQTRISQKASYMISRRNFLGLGAGTLGSFLLNPTKAFSWGAFSRVAPTHQIIAKMAYDMVIRDISGKNMMTFPDIQEILKYDWTSGNWKDGIYGTGPDVEESTPYSWHYWSQRRKWETGLYAVSKHLQELVIGLRTNPNGPGATRAASWTSHFIADMHVPYHVFGISAEEAHQRYRSGYYRLSETESGPLYLYRLRQPPNGWGGNQNFQKALEYYCINYPLKVNGEPNKTNWFDPWYFNGLYKGNVITGSHASWELDAHRYYWNPQQASKMLKNICSASYYDPTWKNVKVKFGQDFWKPATQQAAHFADECAKRTANVNNVKIVFNSPSTGIVWAMRSAATLFRASMSTLTLRIDKEYQGNGKFKYTGIVTNNHQYATVNNTEVQLMIKQNGKWRGSVGKIGSISHGKEGYISWDLDTRKLKDNQAQMEVSGIYPNKTPDLGYVNKYFTIDRVEQYEEPQVDKVPDDGQCNIPQGAEVFTTKYQQGYLRRVRGEKRFVGPYKSWHDPQRTKIRKECCYDKYGTEKGLYTEYREDGRIRGQYIMKRGSIVKTIIDNGRRVSD